MEKSFKSNSFFLHLFYILTTIALYFLNNNRTDSFNEFILNSILSVFTLVFSISLVILFLYGLLKFKKTDLINFVLIFIVFLLTLLFRKYLSIHFIYLLSGYYVFKNKCNLNSNLVKVSVYLTLTSIIIQLCIFNFYGRPVLSHWDPNYSGFYIFTFFLFCRKYGFKKISILVGFLGFLTLSRNYLLAIVVFTFCSFDFIGTIIKRIRMANFYLIFFIGIGLPLIIGTLYLSKAEEGEIEVNYENDAGRLLNFKDKSNEHRFLANALFIEDLSSHPRLYLWGRDLEVYTQQVFMNSPHNSFFQLILNYGLFFTFFYMLLFGGLINESLLNKENIPYVFSLLIYFIFLGGGIYGMQIIYLFFVLKNNVRKTIEN